MSSVLNSLVECSRLLSSDKIAERKKQIDELPFLLSDGDVLEALDKNGTRQDKFTWSRLFDSVKSCVYKEVEHMEKESQRGTASSTRDRKKKACAGLVRLVISQANSRAESQLKTTNIVSHLLAVMRSEFTWNLLSTEYSNILLKEVLAHRRIVCDILPPALDEFIIVYTELYRTSTSVTHHDLIMRILAAIIQLGYFQTVLDASRLFTFFKDTVLKSRSSLNISQQESLMFTCTTFCKAVAVNCRLQLCYFGETVMDPVLSMLDRNISKNFKAILIDFLQLQMVCHHPRGASSEAEGMVSCDSELWKKNVHRLYRLLLNELQHPAFRSRHSTKSLGLESDFLELLVDVLHAEIVFVFKEEEVCSSSTKRRRIDHGFAFLMDTIHTVGTDVEDVVAWLQLVGGSLRKYPETTATFQELASSIALLHQLQTDCKRYVIMSPLLDCIRWILCAYLRVRPTNNCEDEVVQSWIKIYELTVRTVSLNHCVNEGHNLFCALFNSKVLSPGPELWCFLTPGLSSPSVASLKTLSAIATNCQVQKLCEKGRGYRGGGGGLPAATNGNKKPLEMRLHLLDWLLPNYLEENSLSVFKRNDLWPIELQAQTLVALTLGDHCSKSVPRSRSLFRDDSLEDIFLQATNDMNSPRKIDCIPCDSTGGDGGNTDDPSNVKSDALCSAKNKLIEYLLRDCSVLLDPDMCVESRDVVTISAQCCLVTKCVGDFVRAGAMSMLDLIETRLCDVLQNLMARLGDLLYGFCAEEKSSVSKQRVLAAVVFNLRKLYAWDGNPEFRQTMSQFCREITSERLVDMFFDCLYGNVFPNNLVAMKSKLNSTGNGGFDPDFDFSEHSVDSNSTGSEPRFVPVYKYGGFFAADCEHNAYVFDWPMSDVERLQLNVALLLTTWCENPRPPILSPLRPKAASISSAAASRVEIQNRILRPLLEEKFNFEIPFNVHLVFTVMLQIVKPAHTLDNKSLDDLLKILRRVCKVHFKDGEMSVTILVILSNLLTRLNEYYVIRNFDASIELGLRDHVFHLLNAFCFRKSQGKCGPYTELGIVKALAALAKCDLRFLQREHVAAAAAKDQCLTPSLIPSFMESKYFPVSFYAAKNVQLLLRFDTNNPDGIKMADDVFKSVNQSISNAAVSTDGSLKQQDQQSNWTSSSIAAITQLAVGSPFCLKHALFEMCVHAKEVQSSVPLIRKALTAISMSLGFPSVSTFIDSQIDYLVYRCLEKNWDLERFIWRLTDSDTLQEFYQKHYQSILPLLFAMSKWERFREPICEALGRTPTEIVADCFPRIMTFVFPGYVDDNSNVVSKRTAQVCYDLVDTILSKEVVNQQLASRLGEVVVSLLKCIHLSHVQHDRSIVLPPSSPPSYGLETVQASLNYIMAVCNERSTSIVSILCKNPDGIQKVLLALQLHINSSYQSHDAYNAIVAYKFFVSLVWKEFEGGLQNTSAFLLHDVVTTLFHLLKRCGSHARLHAVIWECCSLLQDIATSAVQVCLAEFSKLVPLFLSGLTVHSMSVTTDFLRDQAISVINFLILDMGDKLKDTLVHLEPFPDLPIFASAREKYVALKYADGPLTLRQEIKHFLRGLELNEGHLRPEGLQFLRLQLVSRPTELKELIGELQSLCYADECSESVLYCVLVELVHLCCESAFKAEIAVEAAQCLGELGPLLVRKCVVLEGSKTHNVALRAALHLFRQDSIAQRNVFIFHKLWMYLCDSSVDVKVIISQVLKRSLSTKSGHAFANKYKSKNAFPLFGYLHPFGSKTTVSAQIKRMTDDEFSRVVNTVLMWSSDECKFDEYIVRLCSTLIETGVHGCEILQHLQPVCNVKVDFCTELFPFLLHSILLADTNEFFFKIVSRQIDEFFAKFVRANDTSSRCASVTSSSHGLSEVNGVSGPIYLDKRAIKVMLNAIQFLRLQNKRNPKGRAAVGVSPWDNNYRLDIDYLHVAQAAQFCAAHFSGLLFVETWCEVKSRNINCSDSSNSSGSPISILRESCPDETKDMQDLLLQIYRSIGDPDAVYGCGMAHLSDANVRLQYYEHERRWDRAVFAYDLSMRSDATVAFVPPVGMLRTLQKLGLQHLSDIYLENVCRESQSADIREFQSECAWKTTCWSDSSAGSWLDDDDKSGFHELVNCSLGALRQGNHNLFRNLVTRAHNAVVFDLKHDDVECMTGLSRPLTCLYALNNLKDFSVWNRHDDRFVANLLSKWVGRDAVVQRDYDVMDQVLSLRNAILQFLEAICGRKQPDVLRALVDCEERQAKLARKNGLLQLAETHISRLRRRSDLVIANGLTFTAGWKLEEAKIFWDGEQHETAKSHLGIFIKELEGQDGSDMYAQALGLYGNWLIETHSENASSIMEKYLEKSISLLERRGSVMDAETTESLMNAHVTTARYADSHYKRIVHYLKSSDYESKQQMVVGSKEEARRLRASGDLAGDKKRSYIMLMKQSEIDNRELESMREDRLSFLLKAVQNYAKCLIIGTSQDIRVFRLVSLWFQNKEMPDLNGTIKDLAAKVPTHKFLPLIYQLAARLGNNSAHCPIFNRILLEIIEGMTVDHPHHTLLVILALANATKDEAYLSTKKKPTLKKAEETERAVAARDLLNRVRKKNRLGALVSDVEKVCDALIAFSYWQPANVKKTAASQIIDSDQPLAKLGRLDRVPPLTLKVPVDPTCRYNNIPGIVKYMESFNFCGGINVPKKIICRGTDGVLHTQLVKGNDDLRQDAVMQQVFVQVNGLLSSNLETARRSLSIRTYKVVPLSQRSGILQWCENTMPLAEYLVDAPDKRNGAHSRYYPKDDSVSECRQRMENVASKSFHVKYDTFVDVCRKLRPVFRHFFLENFPDAPTWYERRMAYVRSVATTSIVGYILGLGDRHVNNILVDKRSAEFVHIDLGIAFEQGRVLPTPELVPFRLTRDVVDAMGITGTEGPFRRCCEKTMTVMRNSHEVVSTILEVLLYDPLYQWSLTPLKARKIQDARISADTASVFDVNDGEASTVNDEHTSIEEDINKLAERALHRLQQKLQGVEEGTALSVSGQVSHLIQEAMDPCNLCRMFKGWQAYL